MLWKNSQINGEVMTYQEYNKKENDFSHLFRVYFQNEKDNSKTQEITENADGLLIKSQGKEIKIQKPFVQKPFDSSDHRVSLYYQQSLGHGRRALSRQNHGHTSSIYSQYQKDQNFIRKDQNYIYEQFIGTNVFDIKVYMIGDFIFAQSRRSPMLDVQRDLNNSQLRYEIELTAEEIEYCNRIARKFKLPICGLDILRSNEKSYVCDINGWGFAKGKYLKEQVNNYQELVAGLLKNMVFERFFPDRTVKINYKSFRDYKKLFKPTITSISIPRKIQQLRSLVSIISFNRQKPQIQLPKLYNFLTDMGESIRKNSYDDINCLGLYSKFQHLLKVESSCDPVYKMGAGYFLKGYLGIKGELSPLLISMVNTDNIKKTSDTPEMELKGLSFFVQKVLGNMALCQKESLNDNSDKLRTNIYIGQPLGLMTLQRILQSGKQLPSKENALDYQDTYIQEAQNIHLSRIEFKIYQKMYTLQHQKAIKQKQQTCRFRIQIRTIFVLETSQNALEEIINSFNLNQTQFKQLFRI